MVLSKSTISSLTTRNSNVAVMPWISRSVDVQDLGFFARLPLFSLFQKTDAAYKKTGYKIRLLKKQEPKMKSLQRSQDPSPERRCSSRTFRYGYLVTT